MRIDELREKVIRGLECCIKSIQECQCVNGCPYEEKCWGDTDDDGGDPLYLDLMRDCLSLLKAQEPRVLTLEEVKDSIGEAIYFESRGTYMGKVVFPILPALFTPHGLMRYVHPQSSHYSELGLHDYGKVWRCWTSRPMDEQREAAKWDDKSGSD